MFPDEFGVSFIAQWNRHRSISHDRFGTGCGDLNILTRFFHDFIAHIIKAALLRSHYYLFVRERGLGSNVPINHPSPAIDQAFAVEIDKNSEDSADIIVIKSVSLSRPITGAAEPL